jgi:excisionase family DNA binding protein
MPDGAPSRYAYPPRRMRVEEAARYVGVSETAFRALDLPAVRVGGTVGWLREDLDAWLDARAGRAAPSPEGPNPWHT